METFAMPIGGKSILRSTGEEVEVIDSQIKERGARSDEDWVTYIDSEGNEHLREHLNFMLDFKPNDDFKNMFNKVFNDDWKKNTPSTNNSRIFDMSKELIVKCNYTVSNAVDTALSLVKQIDSLEI